MEYFHNFFPIILPIQVLKYAQAEKFPKNFYNAGVSEQNMMGLAAGLASEKAQVFVLPTLFAFFSGFAKHPAPDPEKESQLNLKYGYAWNIENLTCNGKNFEKLTKPTHFTTVRSDA